MAPVSLSQDNFEKLVEEDLTASTAARIRKCRTLRGKQFIFRCFVMPVISWGVFEEMKKQFPNPPYQIYKPWSYMIAQSRTLREMVFRKELTFDHSDPPAAELGFGGDRYDYWLGRFDAWRHAVVRSFWYCLERKGGISSYPDELANAASLGAIFNLWGGLPEEVVGKLAAEMRQESPRHARVFHKQAARPSSIKWTDPPLDLWLIEVWPLAVGYGWNYYDVWRVAKLKFPDTTGKPRRSLRNTEALSNHCKMKELDLRLGAEAKKRVGQPRAGQPLPPMADLALEIDGFRSPGVIPTREEIRVCILT
jgi:hypothetical protein